MKDLYKMAIEGTWEHFLCKESIPVDTESLGGKNWAKEQLETQIKSETDGLAMEVLKDNELSSDDVIKLLSEPEAVAVFLKGAKPKNSVLYVLALQAGLKMLGHNASTNIDGIFRTSAQRKAGTDSITMKAVNSFQKVAFKDNPEEWDSKPGPKTIGKLVEMLKGVSNTKDIKNDKKNTKKNELNEKGNNSAPTLDNVNASFAEKHFNSLPKVSKKGDEPTSIPDATDGSPFNVVQDKFKKELAFNGDESSILDPTKNGRFVAEADSTYVDLGIKEDISKYMPGATENKRIEKGIKSGVMKGDRSNAMSNAAEGKSFGVLKSDTKEGKEKSSDLLSGDKSNILGAGNFWKNFSEKYGLNETGNNSKAIPDATEGSLGILEDNVNKENEKVEKKTEQIIPDDYEILDLPTADSLEKGESSKTIKTGDIGDFGKHFKERYGLGNEGDVSISMQGATNRVDMKEQERIKEQSNLNGNGDLSKGLEKLKGAKAFVETAKKFIGRPYDTSWNDVDGGAKFIMRDGELQYQIKNNFTGENIYSKEKPLVCIDLVIESLRKSRKIPSLEKAIKENFYLRRTANFEDLARKNPQDFETTSLKIDHVFPSKKLKNSLNVKVGDMLTTRDKKGGRHIGIVTKVGADGNPLKMTHTNYKGTTETPFFSSIEETDTNKGKKMYDWFLAGDVQIDSLIRVVETKESVKRPTSSSSLASITNGLLSLDE